MMMSNKEKTASGGKKKGILIVLIILLLLSGGVLAGFGMLNTRRKEYTAQMQAEAKRFYEKMNGYQFRSTHPMSEDEHFPQLPDRDFSALCKAEPEKLTITPTDPSLNAFSLTWEEFDLDGTAPFGDAMYFAFRMENEIVTEVIACEQDILSEDLLSQADSRDAALNEYLNKNYIAYYP